MQRWGIKIFSSNMIFDIFLINGTGAFVKWNSLNDYIPQKFEGDCFE